MEIRLVTDTADVIAASPLFDHTAIASEAERFLMTPGHILFVAYIDEEPVGFVSGVETIHPDKGVEMFLYELAVADDHQSQGIGTALIEQLRDFARERGCYGMWVLTDADNEAALKAYRRAGGGEPDPQVLLAWDFSSADAGASAGDR